MGDQSEINVEKLETLTVTKEFQQLTRLFDKRSPNLLRVAGISNKEVYINRIVAWLLNPIENHHLGEKPLRYFLLKATEPSSEEIHDSDESRMTIKDIYDLDLEEAELHVEYPINVGGNEDRRLDILIRLPEQKVFFVVENKIWAEASKEKQNSYWKWLKERLKAKDCNRAMGIFLTPFGKRSPCEKFSSVSYKSWIEELDAMIEGDNQKNLVVKQFVQNMKEEVLQLKIKTLGRKNRMFFGVS